MKKKKLGKGFITPSFRKERKKRKNAMFPTEKKKRGRH